MLVRTLILGDKPEFLQRARGLLSNSEALINGACGAEELWKTLAHLSKGSVDLVIADLDSIPDEPTQTISAIRGLPNKPRVIVISGDDDPRERANLIAAGCEATLHSSVEDPSLRNAIDTIIEQRRAEVVAPYLAREAQPSLSDFVSDSPAMQKLLAKAQRVANSDTSVLILGETGVGKERLARAIHAEGPRCDGPFVAVNCAAIPESLLESELFGHEKGAFTGASRSRRGRFELAHRGTFFLDEIADLPLGIQVKLLRLLQERQVTPVGSEHTIDVDVRIIAATNRDVLQDIDAGRFRSDLYYRISVVAITIPPLRERTGDIAALADAYRGFFATRLRKPAEDFSREATAALRRYPWPGNVRELANVVEHAILLCDGPVVELEHLPELLAGSAVEGRRDTHDNRARGWLNRDGWAGKQWKQVRQESLERLEKEYLVEILTATGGRVGDAARIAGMDPRSLFGKLKAHGLRKEDFRPNPALDPNADVVADPPFG